MYGDGSDLATTARRKSDNTYTYVYSTNSTATINVAAEAKDGIVNGDKGDPFDYDYITSVYQIAPGNRKYFPNKAKKKGFSATYLALSTADHKSHRIVGKWSPDNISGYGNP